MDIAKTIGANLTALMSTTPGLDTIQKLERRSGVGFGTVRRAKNGEGNITVEKLTSLAAAFHCHPADLLRPMAGSALLENGDYRPVIDSTCERVPMLASEGERKIIPLPAPLVAELAAVAGRIDDHGLALLIGYAQRLAEERPRERKGNAAG